MSTLDRVRRRLVDEHLSPEPHILAQLVREESQGLVSDIDVLRAVRHLRTDLTGAGILERFLRLPGVSDVLVTPDGAVWVDRGQGVEPTTESVDSEETVRSLARRLASRAGRRLDEASPWMDGVIEGLCRHPVRVHIVLSPVAVGGTSISLRVLRPATGTLEHLRSLGAFEDDGLRLLRGLVAAKATLLVVGATGSGKTTLLGALLSEVSAAERIVCVEDSAELAPLHPHVVRLVTRAANSDGAGEVTLTDLVRQSLRMRPDRVVVGEVRGPEIVDLLTALNTGHTGGMGTLHANGVTDVPARIHALAALAGIPREAADAQIIAALDVVVAVRRDASGRRVLDTIGVVAADNGRAVVRADAWARDRLEEMVA